MVTQNDLPKRIIGARRGKTDKNDGMIYWPDPADEKTKGPTRGSNGCEWCIINLGRGNCTYISDLANCPLTDEQVILLNNFFLVLQQRKLGPENEDAIRKAIAGEGRLYLVPPLYMVKYDDSGELISCEIVKEQGWEGER